MSIDEIIKSAIGSHAVGGGAGGLVRSLSKQEAWQRVVIAVMIGSISSVYLTPLLVWTMIRYLDASDGGPEILLAINACVSFCLGVVSFGLAGMIEMIVEKIVGGNKK